MEEKNNSGFGETTSNVVAAQGDREVAISQEYEQSRFNRLIHSQLGAVIVGGIVVGIFSALTAYLVAYMGDSRERDRQRSFTASLFIIDINNMEKAMRKDFASVNKGSVNSLDGLEFEVYNTNSQNLIHLGYETTKVVIDLYDSFNSYHDIRLNMMIEPNNLRRKSLEKKYSSTILKVADTIKFLEEAK